MSLQENYWAEQQKVWNLIMIILLILMHLLRLEKTEELL